MLYGGRERIFAAATNGLSYPGVFECRYVVVVENGLEATLWWLRFYRATVFRCYTPPQAPGLSLSAAVVASGAVAPDTSG